MATYAVQTRLRVPDAIKAAIDHFGPDGIGLTVQVSTPESAYFQAPDGFVRIRLTGEDPTELEIQTREYDIDAQKFIRRIG